MAQTSTQRQRRYRHKLRIRTNGMFNFRCCSCHSTERLEFAHKEQSFLSSGRGFENRITLAYKYPDSFLLLCHNCHAVYDAILNLRCKE